MQKMCPYCDQKLEKLTPAHLRKHGKTRFDVMTDYPKYAKYMESRLEKNTFKEVLQTEIDRYYNRRYKRAYGLY